MEHRFAFGQKVIADGDKANPLLVVGVIYRPEGAVEFECVSWVDGKQEEVNMPSWRLAAHRERT